MQRERELIRVIGERKLCFRVSVRMHVCDVDVKYAIRDMVANLRRIKIEHLRQMQLICNESIGIYEYWYRNESAATATAGVG